jgi:hypothetical protein
MRRPDLKTVFTSYAVAWVYLGCFIVAEVIYALLSPQDQAALVSWASTSVHNLHHDPVGSLVVSAFVTQGFPLAWPVLIALALFGANGALGNWRVAVTCAAGHVIGTMVSEGILWYRILHGTMPGSDRLILDVGPSYVVVTAIAVALIWGSWLARCTAATALVILIVIGQIFSGLSQLSVSAVGHATALFVGATLGSLLALQRRGARAPVRGGLVD